ncbi:MAG: hypothetical protein JOZ96_14280 [Acidobacteria bacterium]|nr:hypothetical protein [Acidobacteriota bacterium]
MPYKIENIETGLWHRIIKDLKSRGFKVVYRYDNFDVGIDFDRVELRDPAGGELVVFEWDNWMEGEVMAAPALLEALREKYQLGEIVRTERENSSWLHLREG